MGWLIGLPLGLFRMLLGILMVLLRVALPVLLGVGAVLLARRLRRGGRARQEPEQASREPEFDGPVYTVDYEEVKETDLSAVPDEPVSFGYQTAWMAVRCDDPGRVLSALSGRDVQRANWTTGLEAAFRDPRRVFVSPVLGDFVLVVGLPEGEEVLPARLAKRFAEVQCFATHHVTEYHAWTKYVGGALVRDYCYAGEAGAVLRETGDLTREEIALGFGRFPRMGGELNCEAFPGEEDVLDLAAAWGIDPRFTPGAYPPGTGWVCTLA